MSRTVHMTTAKHPTIDENTIAHKIYDPSFPSDAQELEENCIVPVENWKEAQEGDWFVTTDKQIIQCLRRSFASHKEYIRTCIGTFQLSGKKCNTALRESRYTFSGKRPWSPSVSKARCGKREQQFVNIITTHRHFYPWIHTGSWDSILKLAYQAFQHVWPHTRMRCNTTWKRFAKDLLERPHIRREIEKYLGNPAAEISNQWMVDEALKAYKEIDKADGLTRLKALNEIGKLRKVVGADVTSVRPGGLSAEEKERIEEEVQKDLRKEPDKEVAEVDNKLAATKVLRHRINS